MERRSFAARLKDAGINAIATVAVAGLAFATAIAARWFSFAGKDQELRVHLVEIAIGILRADPKEDVAPARQWAIDVIERDSGVKFTAEDRAALLHKPLGDNGWNALFDGGDFPRAGKSKSLVSPPPAQ